MKDLSLHILDIVENSIRAEANRVEISVVEDEEKDMLTLKIEDNGKGMKKEILSRAAQPFFTSKLGRRVGMGLALLAQAAREANGKFEIASTPETGTRIKATFLYSHPDRKPLGDIAATLETLIVGNPGVDFLYERRIGGTSTRFDTREVVNR